MSGGCPVNRQWAIDPERGRLAGAAGRAAQRAQRADTAPLREAIEARGLTLYEVAARLGWYRPDGQRVGRILGAHVRMNHGRRIRQESCDYHVATALAEAIGVDPVEVGL